MNTILFIDIKKIKKSFWIHFLHLVTYKITKINKKKRLFLKQYI